MYNNDASISELEFSFDIGLRNQYPFNIPALSGLTKLQLHPQVTFFVGENGTGKSTLIEAIAVALGFNAEGGTKNFNFSSRASHSDLYKYLKFPFRTKRHKDGFFYEVKVFLI
ncbi:AAA family ATPase [Flectobacillus sp. BAB-3569]|uniref:AAA family ATPase n=1 Tax=Flectobacillus sp. BAB-3569 TaxID=1509483 RepID=UPI001C3E63FF|nr:AAA family ATPase [Flectobacillus sp. BAB-3569]